MEPARRGSIGAADKSPDLGYSWKPSLEVSTSSVDPHILTRTDSTLWQAIGAAALKIFSYPLTTAPAGAVSLKLAAPKLKVLSFQFTEQPADAQPIPGLERLQAA